MTAFTLASVDSKSGDTDSPLHPVRSAAATVLSPVQSGLASLTRPVTGAVNALDEAHTRSGLVDELTAENAALQLELRDALGRAADAAAFTDLTAVARASGTQLKLGHVIAVNATRGYAWTVALGLGSADGITVDSAVIDAGGLVGRVISVAPHASTVLLAADPLSTVGIRMAGSREVGTLEGHRRGTAAPDPVQPERADAARRRTAHLRLPGAGGPMPSTSPSGRSCR